MAQKRKEVGAAPRAVTAERAARLFRLLQFLRRGQQSREALTRHLGRDDRSFYRDLELLRASGIDLPSSNGSYYLDEAGDAATARLPFPDPVLTLGEAQLLAKGRSPAARKLKKQIAHMVKAPTKRAAKNLARSRHKIA
jgi:predicted DNA-binding transcriptional regulator YafY